MLFSSRVKRHQFIMSKFSLNRGIKMSGIPVTNFSGFVFRKASLKNAGVSLVDLSEKLELEILAENNELVTFKTCFPDRVQFLIGEMKKLRFEYVDDYFVLELDLPEWLVLSCSQNQQG